MKFTTWPLKGRIVFLDTRPNYGQHLVTSRQSSHEVHQAHDCPVCSAVPHLRQEPRVRVNAFELVPVRVHKQPRWDRTGSYHRRIQRKWTKRWGTRTLEPQVVLGMSAELARAVNSYGPEAEAAYETFLRVAGTALDKPIEAARQALVVQSEAKDPALQALKALLGL